MVMVPHLKHAFKTGILIISAENSGNIYCLLGAHHGISEAPIEDAQQAVRIDRVRLRGIRF
jgi:hypothetical protein